MKLRLKGNTIRLRLSKTEVEKLEADKYLEEITSFGNASLTYALQSKTGITKLSAEFEKDKITVFIPESFINGWEANDVIGFDSKMNEVDSETLYILVEKDFKCINETEEDQSDNFENPDKFC